MKNRILCLLVLLGLGMQAQATLITFEPNDQTINVGDSVFVDLVVSDLGANILAAFDLDVFFNPAILSFVNFEFEMDCGPAFFSSCLDHQSGFGSLQDVFDFGTGAVLIAELSTDLDMDLILDQPNEFVLGTLEFLGLAPGFSSLDIAIFDLATIDAMFLDADTLSGSITVMDPGPGPNPVPEPGTVLLLMSGLLGLRMARRKHAVRA